MTTVTNLFRLLVLATVLCIARPSHATLIVGSKPSTASGPGSGLGIGDYDFSDVIVGAGISFTMPGQSYLLTDVVLRLAAYDGPSEGWVKISEDGVGVIATLTDPPGGSSPADFTFTPSSTVMLQANKKYSLTVENESLDFFFWQIADGLLPTGVGTFNSMLLSEGTSTRGPFLEAPGLPLLRFEINGTLVAPASTRVPDTGSTLILLLMTATGLTLYLAELKRRQRLKAIRETLQKPKVASKTDSAARAARHA